MLRKGIVVLILTGLFLGTVPVFEVQAAAAPEISARSGVLMEKISGQILFDKDMHKKLPIASTTKILTALITLEQPNLDEYFVVDETAIRVEGSSMGLKPGDKVTLRGLAVGMLLASGNDAANAAAVRIDGSIDKFMERMNMRASEIGMMDSNFITPSGLDAKEHYSTAYDMALLARTALGNPVFGEICNKKNASIEFGNPPFRRFFANHNRLLTTYQGTIGLKTGFTKKAGRCLVAAAERNGITLIAVTLDAPDDWYDHSNLFNNGFGRISITEKEYTLSVKEMDISGGVKLKLSLASFEKQQSLMIDGKEIETTPQVLIPPFVLAEIKKGSVIGKVNFVAKNGFVIDSISILADEDIAMKPYEKNMWEKFLDFLMGLFEGIQKFFKR